jgi:hypothetical protein
MCIELILAIIYFVTIFTVNFFLLKLLSSYTKDIRYMLKVKNILKLNKSSKLEAYILLYLYDKKDYSPELLLKLLNTCSDLNDSLTIGKIYSSLLEANKKKNSTKKLDNLYFELLENQYLSRKINF